MDNEFKKNVIKEKINKGETVFGIYIGIPSPTLVEMAGYSGFDFVRIDISHMQADLLTIENMIRAAELSGVCPMFRVNNDKDSIERILEAGAMGIVVPDIESPSAARSAVDAAKFYPIGDRGVFSAARVSRYGCIGSDKYVKWTNEEILMGIQIETEKAANRLGEILEEASEGIDIILSGRGDLANSLGLPGQKNHPAVLELEERIFKEAKSHGKSISVNLDPTAENFAKNVSYWKDKGADIITLGHDLNLIRKNFEKVLKISRES